MSSFAASQRTLLSSGTAVNIIIHTQLYFLSPLEVEKIHVIIEDHFKGWITDLL